MDLCEKYKMSSFYYFKLFLDYISVSVFCMQDTLHAGLTPFSVILKQELPEYAAFYTEFKH